MNNRKFKTNRDIYQGIYSILFKSDISNNKKYDDISDLFRTYENSPTSSNVDKIQYDTVSKELIIRFKSGSVYTYYNVPEAIYYNIEDGQAGTTTDGPEWSAGKFPSVGAAVHQYLIGKYNYKKGGSFK